METEIKGTKEQRTHAAILTLALQNAGADAFLVNVIQCWHARPMKKLRGLLDLVNAGHEVDTAPFDMDVLLVDGERTAWSDLESGNEGKAGLVNPARLTA